MQLSAGSGGLWRGNLERFSLRATPIGEPLSAKLQGLQKATRPPRYPEMRLMLVVPTILFALALAAL